MRSLAILGATGSIGGSALRLLREHPEIARVVLLAAHEREEELLDLIAEFKPAKAFLTGRDPRAEAVKRAARCGCTLEGGDSALLQELAGDAYDCALLAMTGAAGLRYGLEVLQKGRRLALANKEPMVIAGGLFREAARIHGGEIIPVDSEHSAIFQCLLGQPEQSVHRLILTGSGGPFHRLPAGDFAAVKVSEALAHPTWNMGPKISIDSATMMNKALEMLEARWLFEVPIDRIEVTIHRQSLVHSMVEFIDGSMLAQMGSTDMRCPILYALSHPERVASKLPRLDFSKQLELSFERVNPFLSQALELARDCDGNCLSAVTLNAANEVFVEAFLSGKTGFAEVYPLIRRSLEIMHSHAHRVETLKEVLEADLEVRRVACSLISPN
ncbi:MAG: 1-deoxy-D-xylulose-5-phosphate reductoisomerase [Planctomycetes bacterium]|nr:1-deoxy-D-xylulose-5-phosphate reductoisomerase [Planctomycetota bacterium]